MTIGRYCHGGCGCESPGVVACSCPVLMPSAFLLTVNFTGAGSPWSTSLVVPFVPGLGYWRKQEPTAFIARNDAGCVVVGTGSYYCYAAGLTGPFASFGPDCAPSAVCCAADFNIYNISGQVRCVSNQIQASISISDAIGGYTGIAGNQICSGPWPVFSGSGSAAIPFSTETCGNPSGSGSAPWRVCSATCTSPPGSIGSGTFTFEAA